MKYSQLKAAELQQAPLVPLVQWSAEQAVFARAVDYVKLLALLAVERAASGHPGMVLGCAPFTKRLNARRNGLSSVAKRLQAVSFFIEPIFY